jgi:hypothetical protein
MQKVVSADIYIDARRRRDTIHESLTKVPRHVVHVVIRLDDGTSNGEAVDKNGMGSGSCDPSVKACFSFNRWWSDGLVSMYGTACIYHLHYSRGVAVSVQFEYQP